jgi:hypothetical protein
VAAYLLASWSERRAEDLDQARQAAGRESADLTASEQARRGGAAEKPEPAVTAAKPRGRFPVPANAINPEERKVVLAAILQKLGERQATADRAAEGGGETKPKPDDQALGSLDKEYIQQQIREIIPLIKECYEAALQEQQDLGGKLVVEFSIIGDEEYGGLVEDSKIIEGDLKGSDGIATCVRETMYAMKFSKPQGGGRVIVRYPFKFRTASE